MEQTTMGGRIKRIRNSLNMTMEEFAKAIKVSGKSTVNEWEKDRSIPSYTNLKNIATLASVDANWIIHGTPREYVFKVLREEALRNSDLRSDILSYLSTRVELPSLNNMPLSEIKELDLKGSLDKIKQDTDIKVIETLDFFFEDILKTFNILSKKDIYTKEHHIIDLASLYFEEELVSVQNTFEGALRNIDKFFTASGLGKPRTYDKSLEDIIDNSLQKEEKEINAQIDSYYFNKLNDLFLNTLHESQKIQKEYLDLKQKLNLTSNAE
ncbi:helix-turn-helix domain-containing protein [Brochothrix thermosphacta]|uniref:helix-turn-helix domain-containing protein n=1 Tax=Brochothrix thermosphacta TaxID=2756 RepID=UPI00083FBDEA|nr:helix-turn-helix transcriptional regulator [Brochothrix thermosphacta]ODJ61690.1 hypothetical protein BFR35_03085 [Brochothrix thermosphacta]